jgi:lipopolysaccharide transport system permease protein
MHFRLDRLLPRRWHTQLDLLWTLVSRELAVKYQGAVLGNFWSVLNQLSQLLIFTYVFSVVLQVKLNLTTLPENQFTFGLWLFAGLLPWTAFTTGLIQATGVVVNNPNLVKKVVFPLMLLPLVPVLAAFIESLMGLGILWIATIVTTSVVHRVLLLLPLVWLPQLALTIGMAYGVAGLTVFLRDIPQTVTVAVNLWFYLTPIVYPIAKVPTEFRQWILWLNPLATIAELYRDIMLVGQIHHWGEWAVATLLSMAVLYGGAKLYRHLRPAFADVI